MTPDRVLVLIFAASVLAGAAVAAAVAVRHLPHP